MVHDQDVVRVLYQKLLNLYPSKFREQLGESMEQTFRDLWNEKRGTKKDIVGFIVWTFIETGIGIVQENFLLLQERRLMRKVFTNFRLSAFISFLLILPFMAMEIVNRRNFNEDFPFVLFFIMWLNICAIGLILLPIVQSGWIRHRDVGESVPAQGNTLLTNPRLAGIMSVVLILSTVIISWLSYLRWEPLERLINGPNPEVTYLPGLFIAVSLISIPIAAGIFAGGPIVSTLQAGGRLFAHPLHLIIVVIISLLFAVGVVSLIVDQWPCFVGVPNCD